MFGVRALFGLAAEIFALRAVAGALRPDGCNRKPAAPGTQPAD